MTSALKLLLSVGLVAVLLLTSNFSEVFRIIRYCDFHFFIMAVIVSFAAMFIAALRWKILLGRYKSNIDYFCTFELVCLSWFYNFFIPGGVAGDFIRGLQCRKHQLSGVQGVASVVVERIIGLGSFMLVGFVALFFLPQTLPMPFPGILVWAILTGASICCIICFIPGLVGHFKFISRLSPLLYEKLELFYDSVCGYRNNGQIVGYALSASFITALSNIGTFYLLSRAAGGEVHWVYFLAYIPVITILSYAPVSFSGLGIRELCFIYLFAGAGMSSGQALAVPLMYFGMMLVLSLAGGIIYSISQSTRVISRIPSDRDIG